MPTPAFKSSGVLETGSCVKVRASFTSRDFEFTWERVEDWRWETAISLEKTQAVHKGIYSPQKPMSKPTAKHVASWLNEAHSDTGPEDSSITGRVFMVEM